jgi:peptidoglycan/xylan/chitin deacetylase (PgdA/CDA1 family)
MRIGTIAAGLLIVWSAAAGAAMAQGKSACPNPDALGVARTVEIDTADGPGFGFEHYKAYDFLRLKEVVLTFDDGPQVGNTHRVLEALAAHCTKATFFSIGKMAAGLPEIIRDVAKAGHTIGTHTWSHADLRKLKDEADWKGEIEKGISAVRRAVGGPIAPFFRYPVLKDTKESLAHLAGRGIAIFSADLDSFDFKFKRQNPEGFTKSVIERLDRIGKGIVLFHDVHPVTAKALPLVLAELKARGYKVVHLRPKTEVKTLAEYDAQVEPLMKGMAAGNSRPLSSVVRTIEEEPAATKTTGSIKK